MKELSIHEPIGSPPTFILQENPGGDISLRLEDTSTQGIEQLRHATGTPNLETGMGIVVKLARAMGSGLTTASLNDAMAFLHACRPSGVGDAMAMSHAIGLWSHTMDSMACLQKQTSLARRGEAIDQLEQLSMITERLGKHLLTRRPDMSPPLHSHLHLHGSAEAARAARAREDALPVIAISAEEETG